MRRKLSCAVVLIAPSELNLLPSPADTGCLNLQSCRLVLARCAVPIATTYMILKSKIKAYFLASAIILVAWASIWAYAQNSGNQLDAKRARDLIRHLGGGDLGRDQVRIKSLSPGVGGTVVEAQIETALRFTEKNGEWQISEIRLGDRYWESAELVSEAVRREKIRRTDLMLRPIAEALENYRRERGSFIVAENIDGLINALPPRFATVRFDLWQQPLTYRGTANSYRLVSSGPDLKSGTDDDIVFEGSSEPRIPK